MTAYTLALAVLSITICEGLKSDGKRPELPKPSNIRITTFDPPGFIISWSPVEGDQNQITGYKVKVWESEKKTVYHYKTKEDGSQELVEEVKPVEKPIHVIPNTKPLVQVVGVNITEARFEGIKLNEEYRIRVQAFNEHADGPYSDPVAFKLHGSED